MPRLVFTDRSRGQLAWLEAHPGLHRQLKAVRAALGKLERDPNHASLNAHPWKGRACPHGKTLFEAYAQNNTPGAYRIFWCHDPSQRDVILIVEITPHP